MKLLVTDKVNFGSSVHVLNGIDTGLFFFYQS